MKTKRCDQEVLRELAGVHTWKGEGRPGGVEGGEGSLVPLSRTKRGGQEAILKTKEGRPKDVN